ncbi:MAG: hypothetical protein LBQ54_05250, partial [Planctomycetaceae bacterium]|nr:hypothetical protein [Planctomycetaceae bacterium]
LLVAGINRQNKNGWKRCPTGADRTKVPGGKCDATCYVAAAASRLRCSSMLPARGRKIFLKKFFPFFFFFS